MRELWQKPPELADCRGLVPIARARLLVHEERPDAVADAALPLLLGPS